jgi:hypothetical protein
VYTWFTVTAPYPEPFLTLPRVRFSTTPPEQVPHPTLLIIRFDNAVELVQHLHDSGHVYSMFHGRFVRK